MGLLDISFYSLAQDQDAFGDEDRGFELLGSVVDFSSLSKKGTNEPALKRAPYNIKLPQ